MIWKRIKILINILCAASICTCVLSKTLYAEESLLYASEAADTIDNKQNDLIEESDETLDSVSTEDTSVSISPNEEEQEQQEKTEYTLDESKINVNELKEDEITPSTQTVDNATGIDTTADIIEIATTPAGAEELEQTIEAASETEADISSKYFSYISWGEGEAYITGYSGPGGEVQVPSHIDCKTVIRIDSRAFSSNNRITSIIIPEGIKSVGTGSFSGCVNLKSIRLPNSLVNISGSAFSYCTSLEDIVIPNGVTNLDSSMFEGCINLKNITLPDKLQVIRDYAFWGCKSLSNINIPYSVIQIGDNNFLG
jgi:hypothetical protein